MARVINFFDGVSSSTTPVIGDTTTSNLSVYPDDATYEASETGAPQEKNIYYNSTIDQVRYYANGAWRTLADTDQVQTFTNKSIDASANTITNLDADNVTVDAISGLTATDVQAAIAEHQTEIEQNASDLGLNTADLVDIRSTTGTSDGDTNMGAYTSTTITDNQSTKQNIIDAAAQIDQNTSDITTLQSNPTFTFQGSWNASTNTPTLANTDTGVLGHSYKVSVAGSHDFGAGSIDFIVGDLVFNDGSVWDKDKEQVVSVAGKQGAVTLVASDITDFDTEVSNNTNVTANTAKVSADGSISTHSDVDTVTTSPTTGDVLGWTGSQWEPVLGASGGIGPMTISNLGLQTSVAANAMTIAIKQADGSSDPTAGAPAKVTFRDATTSTGGFTEISQTSALSITIPSGATLGHLDSEDEFIYVYAVNDGGSMDIAVSGNWYDEGSINSFTAISAASDDGALYANSTTASKGFRFIGRVKSNQTTAGTWAANATEVSLASNKLYIPNEDHEEQLQRVNTVVYNSAAQNFGSGVTKLQWNTAQNDYRSRFDNGNDRIIVDRKSVYMIHSRNVFVNCGATGLELRIYKNGAEIARQSNTDAATTKPIDIMTVTTADSGDYFEIFVNHGDASFDTIAGNLLNEFSVTQLF